MKTGNASVALVSVVLYLGAKSCLASMLLALLGFSISLAFLGQKVLYSGVEKHNKGCLINLSSEFLPQIPFYPYDLS